LRRILPIKELLEGLDSGQKKAKEDFGVEMRWVFDIPREASFPKVGPRIYIPVPANLTLKYALMGRDIGVVGFGLGGYEINFPPEPYSDVFKKAKVHGLLSVPHAGETEGPESIWTCIKELEADRIGHGVRAWEDPSLVKYLADYQIPLEVNPSSNICLRVYNNFSEHPLRQLDEAGVPVTVNSDDPSFFNTTLNHEYFLLAQNFGYSKTDIARIARNAFIYSGLEKTVKARLLAEHDDWVATAL
jgi:aminodeoxyfutalosine deaminase